MTHKSFIRALDDFRSRRPFRPFVIEQAGGGRVKVRHPEAVMIRGGVIEVARPDGGRRLFDTAGVVAIEDAEETVSLSCFFE